MDIEHNKKAMKKDPRLTNSSGNFGGGKQET